MTVGMNRLNQMFRDFKVAEDVGKMMELRRFEVEFEVFGTVYWQDSKRHYLVSKSEETLYQQIQQIALDNTYPLNIQIWRESALVPAGWDEEIEQTIKVNFCRFLRESFPESFWMNIERVIPNIIDDSGVYILDQMQEELNGVFDQDRLKLFESLLNTIYLRKNLTLRSYQRYKEWLKEVRQDMIDEVMAKDLFSRELYGFAYKNPAGQIQYHLNASQRLMFEKMQKQIRNGCLVTPIFRKKYWYNYDYRLEQVRQDFKDLLKKLYDEKFFLIMQNIADLKVQIDNQEYEKILAEYVNCKNDTLANEWKILGRQWGINIQE